MLCGSCPRLYGLGMKKYFGQLTLYWQERFGTNNYQRRIEAVERNIDLENVGRVLRTGACDRRKRDGREVCC